MADGPLKFRVFKLGEARQQETTANADAAVYPSGVLRVGADAHRLWDEVCAEAGSHLNPARLVVADDVNHHVLGLRPARPDDADTVLVRYATRARGFSVALRPILRGLGIVVPRGQRWVVPVRVVVEDTEFGPCLAVFLKEHAAVGLGQREVAPAPATALGDAAAVPVETPPQA